MFDSVKNLVSEYREMVGDKQFYNEVYLLPVCLALGAVALIGLAVIF